MFILIRPKSGTGYALLDKVDGLVRVHITSACVQYKHPIPLGEEWLERQGHFYNVTPLPDFNKKQAVAAWKLASGRDIKSKV